jgi:hypothetical protein
LLFVGSAACAEPIGVVTELSGPLLVKDANGSIRVLAMNSSVEQGDVLATRKDTYAQLSLTDHSSVQLGPDTELTIEKYSFHETTPLADAAVLNLAKGQVRIATGLLGTRDADAFTLKTPSATLDIRRSTLVAEYVMPPRVAVAWNENDVGSQPRRVFDFMSTGHTTGNLRYVSVLSVGTQARLPLELSDSIASSDAPATAVATNSLGRLRLAQDPVPPVSGTRSPGLYVQVVDGLIHMTNPAGSQNFSAGQFGYTANVSQPPVVVPANPGIQFTPPPTFKSSSPPASPTGTGATGAKQVDCEVR